MEIPHVVVMKFENGKVAHEHVWWDQVSVLVQVGLLDPAKLVAIVASTSRSANSLAMCASKIASRL